MKDFYVGFFLGVGEFPSRDEKYYRSEVQFLVFRHSRAILPSGGVGRASRSVNPVRPGREQP
jgi:hypothetical protein